MTYIQPIPNKISTDNSTVITTVSAGEVWTGTGEIVSDYGRAGISIWTPFGESTSGTLTIEVSRDGTNYGGPNRTFSDTAVAEPHMWNIVEKYFRLTYTNGATSASSLVIQTQYSNNANILLGHQLDQTLKNETEAIVTRSVNVGQNPSGTYENVVIGGNIFNTTSNLTSGTTFDSGILDISNYQQVQTHVLASHDGSTNIKFYTDLAGSDLVRELTLPYESANGFELFSAPTFSNYVRYSFTNSSSATQTDFLYETKVLINPLSGQVLNVNAPISDRMVANLGRNVMVGQTEGGSFVNIPIGNEGKLGVEVPFTAFGELDVAEKTPQIQIKFSQGLNEEVVQTLTNKNGSQVSAADGLCTLTLSQSAEAFSQIRSIDVVRYGPGQGMRARFTACFSTGLADSELYAGPGDDDEMLAVGFNGTTFGCLHRSMGDLEVRTLEITGGGDAGGGTFTLTLDDTPVTITVPSGSASIADVCALIVAEAADIFNAGRGWEVHTNDSKSVTFISLVAENASGTFSFADVDSGVTAGTFTQSAVDLIGQPPTDEFIAQTSWNVDVMDGTGNANNPSGMLLDPTKLNVFDFAVQYLGAGDIILSVESSESGHFTPVHVLKVANDRIIPTFRNPTFHMNLIGKTDVGFAGGAEQEIKSASMAGFIEGKESIHGIRHEAKETASTNGVNDVAVLVLHNEEVFNEHRNKVVVYPDHLTFINEATKSILVEVFLNPTHIDSGVTLSPVNSASSVIKEGSPGGTVQGGIPILTFAVAASDSKDVDISHLDLGLHPTHTYVFVVTKTAGGADGNVTIACSWLERI